MQSLHYRKTLNSKRKKNTAQKNRPLQLSEARSLEVIPMSRGSSSSVPSFASNHWRKLDFALSRAVKKLWMTLGIIVLLPPIPSCFGHGIWVHTNPLGS